MSFFLCCCCCCSLCCKVKINSLSRRKKSLFSRFFSHTQTKRESEVYPRGCCCFISACIGANWFARATRSRARLWREQCVSARTHTQSSSQHTQLAANFDNAPAGEKGESLSVCERETWTNFSPVCVWEEWAREREENYITHTHKKKDEKRYEYFSS